MSIHDALDSEYDRNANPMDRLREKIAVLVELNAAKDQALASQGSLLTMAEEHTVRRRWNT